MRKVVVDVGDDDVISDMMVAIASIWAGQRLGNNFGRMVGNDDTSRMIRARKVIVDISDSEAVNDDGDDRERCEMT